MTMKDYLAGLRPGDLVVLDGTGGREISMVFTARDRVTIEAGGRLVSLVFSRRELDGTPNLGGWRVLPDGALEGATGGWRVRLPK
jgi:hypothetical protein